MHQNKSKSPKNAYFPGPSPPGPPPGFCPWTPPGGLKRPPEHSAALAKIVPRIHLPGVPDPGYALESPWPETHFFLQILHVLAHLNDVRAYMARQTGKISDKLCLSPKNPVFRSKNWVYQVINWVYREKLSFSSDKLGLSIHWVFQFWKT